MWSSEYYRSKVKTEYSIQIVVKPVQKHYTSIIMKFIIIIEHQNVSVDMHVVIKIASYFSKSFIFFKNELAYQVTK